MEKAFELTLVELQSEIDKLNPKKLIGTAGSFDSYANIISVRENKIFDASNTKDFNHQFDQFNDLLEEIIASTHQQRTEMQGLIPLRTDMILMASILTKFILKQSGIKQIVTCTYSLKEGLLLGL